MKAENIIALLNRIEQDFAVDDWMIDGIHVWPLLRLDLMMSLHFNEAKELQIKLNFFFKLRQALSMFIGAIHYMLAYLWDHSKNSKPHPVDAVLLGDGVSGIVLSGQWRDRFCDPLIDHLDRKKMTALLLEPLHHYAIPRYTPSLFIQPHLDLALLKSMLFHKVDGKEVQLKDFDRFILFLKTQDLNIPLPDLPRLKTIVKVIKAYSDYYKKVLSIARPKLAFVVSYYGPRGLAFNWACHQLSITSVDIQHGVAGEFNAAYGHWQKVPKEGYETLPTAFWCWREEDAVAIKQWNGQVVKNHQAIIGGNFFANFWQETTHPDEKIAISQDQKTINLLVTLSSIAEHNTLLLKKLMPVMQKSAPHWQWWIRLHPCLSNQKQSIKRQFANQGIHNIDVDRATDLPLYQLFNHMSVHITYLSAAVMEGQLFGVPSVITGEDGLSYFASQIASGWAIYASTPDAILQALHVQLDKKSAFRENQNNRGDKDPIASLLSL